MSQTVPERTTTGVIIEELAKPFKDQSPLAFLVHAREILQEAIEGRLEQFQAARIAAQTSIYARDLMNFKKNPSACIYSIRASDKTLRDVIFGR